MGYHTGVDLTPPPGVTKADMKHLLFGTLYGAGANKVSSMWTKPIPGQNATTVSYQLWFSPKKPKTPLSPLMGGFDHYLAGALIPPKEGLNMPKIPIEQDPDDEFDAPDSPEYEDEAVYFAKTGKLYPPGVTNISLSTNGVDLLGEDGKLISHWHPLTSVQKVEFTPSSDDGKDFASKLLQKSMEKSFSFDLGPISKDTLKLMAGDDIDLELDDDPDDEFPPYKGDDEFEDEEDFADLAKLAPGPDKKPAQMHWKGPGVSIKKPTGSHLHLDSYTPSSPQVTFSGNVMSTSVTTHTLKTQEEKLVSDMELHERVNKARELLDNLQMMANDSIEAKYGTLSAAMVGTMVDEIEKTLRGVDS